MDAYPQDECAAYDNAADAAAVMNAAGIYRAAAVKQG